MTASDSAGHAAAAHGPNGSSASAISASRPAGIDPEHRAALTEVAVGRRRVRRARPMRVFVAADLEAQAPVVRILAAEAGQHAAQPGEVHAGRVGHRARGRAAARARAARRPRPPGRRRWSARRGPVSRRRWSTSARAVDEGLVEVVRERHRRRRRRRRHRAGRSRRSSRPAASPAGTTAAGPRAQPGRVGEQVLDGGAGQQCLVDRVATARARPLRPRPASASAASGLVTEASANGWSVAPEPGQHAAGTDDRGGGVADRPDRRRCASAASNALTSPRRSRTQLIERATSGATSVGQRVPVEPGQVERLVAAHESAPSNRRRPGSGCRSGGSARRASR